MNFLTKFFKASLLLLFVTFFSCSDEIVFSETNSKSELSYDLVGTMHNDGLDELLSGFQQLVKSKNKTLDKIESAEILETFNKSYAKYKTDAFQQNTAEISQKYFSSEESKVRFFYKNESSARKSDDDFLKITINESPLTPKQKELLSLVAASLDDDLLSLEEKQEKLQKIKETAINNITSETEASIVILSINVGISSLQYWSDNMGEWHALVGEESSRRWFSWGDMAKDDVAGAIGGGIGGAAAGALAGGVGAGPGAVAGAVGGGVATSGYNAAKQVLDHYF